MSIFQTDTTRGRNRQYTSKVRLVCDTYCSNDDNDLSYVLDIVVMKNNRNALLIIGPIPNKEVKIEEYELG